LNHQRVVFPEAIDHDLRRFISIYPKSPYERKSNWTTYV